MNKIKLTIQKYILIIGGLFVIMLITAIFNLLSLYDSQNRSDSVISHNTIQGGVTYREGNTIQVEAFKVAQQQIAQGSFDDAEATYRQIITREPNNPSGYVGLGSVLLLKEDYTAAQQAYAHAMSIDPNATMPYLGLGSVAVKRGKDTEAQVWYEKALILDPDLADAHLGLAIASNHLHDRTTAISHLKRFLTLAPNAASASFAQSLLSDLER